MKSSNQSQDKGQHKNADGDRSLGHDEDYSGSRCCLRERIEINYVIRSVDKYMGHGTRDT